MESTLTIEERQRFWAALDKMEASAKKVDKLYVAIVGDEELQQAGILERLKSVEERLEQQDELIIKTKSWIKGAAVAGTIMGSAVGSVVTLLIKLIFKI